jgi:hypothetical protein
LWTRWVAAANIAKSPSRYNLIHRPDRKDIDALERDDPDLCLALRHERAQILKVIRLYRQRNLPPDVLM